jgi:NTE family protein
MANSSKPYKFGIALSGGGARGILHIGVLEALRKYGIHPEIISGTSMGALVGVLYASGMEPLKILEVVKSSKLLHMIQWKLPTNGLLDLKKLIPSLRKYIPVDDFSSLKKPFYCAVTNLNSGLAEIKSSGKLYQWVLASASIPVIFEPQMIDGKTYVDGGLFENLPVNCIRDQCSYLIGVHVNRNDPEENITGVKFIAERAFRLVFAKHMDESIALCDFIIDPSQTRLYNTFDFGKADEIFKIGFEETERQILEITNLVDMNVVIKERQKLQN